MIVISLCLGCKKVNSTSSSSSLIGEWSWISTCGLGGTDCKTPASTYTSNKIVFTSDSLYYNYQNDTLRISGIFHTYESGSEDGIIKYENDPGNADSFSLKHDTLTLANVYGFITWVSQYKNLRQDY
jgi:hypothetical protein